MLISKINGVSLNNIAKINGINKMNVESVNGVSNFNPAAFTFSVKTDNLEESNSTDSDQFRLRLHDSGTYNFTVDWGDGTQDTITTYDDPNLLHTYPVAGTYNIELEGAVAGIRVENGTDRLKWIKILQWGDIAWESFSLSFLGCANLDVTAADIPDLSGVTSMYYAFAYCDSLVGAPSMENWNTSTIETMEGLFLTCDVFNQNIGSWDTSSVISLCNTFYGAFSFNQDIGSWDTSSVMSMQGTFGGIGASFDQDLGGWDVTALTDAGGMFSDIMLSTSNYDALLIGWAAQAVNSGVTFGGGNSKYTAGGDAEAARSTLLGYSWDITDGGEA